MTNRSPDTSTPDTIPSIPGKPTRRPRRAKAPVIRLMPKRPNQPHQDMLDVLRDLMDRVVCGEISCIAYVLEFKATNEIEAGACGKDQGQHKAASLLLAGAVFSSFSEREGGRHD